MDNLNVPPLVITGPTASGKTRLAVHVAEKINGEIISADSRQVYRGMDIGTGKDLADYQIKGSKIPYHLIDIREAGEEYNVAEFQKDFARVYSDIRSRGKTPVLTGGTGLYIDSVLKNFQLTNVPVNQELREKLREKDKAELQRILNDFNRSKLSFDTSTHKRLVRAIEISQFLEKNEVSSVENAFVDFRIFCIKPERKILLERIKTRLRERLDQGMIDEVRELLAKGISPEKLKYYGLEYKFVTEYLEGAYSFEEMYEKLNVAIRQYAKRQMTWFRRMERNGFDIQWIDGEMPLSEQVGTVLHILEHEK